MSEEREFKAIKDGRVVVEEVPGLFEQNNVTPSKFHYAYGTGSRCLACLVGILVIAKQGRQYSLEHPKTLDVDSGSDTLGVSREYYAGLDHGWTFNTQFRSELTSDDYSLGCHDGMKAYQHVEAVMGIRI